MDKYMCEGQDESKNCRNLCYRAMQSNLSHQFCHKLIEGKYNASKKLGRVLHPTDFQDQISAFGAGTRGVACRVWARGFPGSHENTVCTISRAH